MHELLPFINGSINNVLEGITYFTPEAYLAALFIIVLATDLLFGKTSVIYCKIIACAGLLLVLFKDYQQYQLLYSTGQAAGHIIFSGMMLVNRTAISFKYIIDTIALILLLYFTWDKRLAVHPKGLSDIYSIAIGSVLGLHLMVMAVNLLSVYLAIEFVSIASYLMVAYKSERVKASEAGLKYVLFGAACSAIMLYGMSVLYAFTGSLEFLTGNMLPHLLQLNKTAVFFPVCLILVGIGFKLSFFPLQFWVPDVYEGAPTPVTAWLSALPKVAGFALLINFVTPFVNVSNSTAFNFPLLLSVLGVVTMIAGNFAALMQQNIKRMLAYSSVGHTGFALMAVVTFTSSGISSLLYYLAVYALANIAALALATYFENVTGATTLDEYRGLGSKYPVASICFIVVLISLTGLPVTAGFTAKLLVFSNVYSVYEYNHSSGLLVLLLTGAITTVVALFYYIKIPLNLFLRRNENLPSASPGSFNIIILSIIITFLLIFLGIFPNLLVNIL